MRVYEIEDELEIRALVAANNLEEAIEIYFKEHELDKRFEDSFSCGYSDMIYYGDEIPRTLYEFH